MFFSYYATWIRDNLTWMWLRRYSQNHIGLKFKRANDHRLDDQIIRYLGLLVKLRSMNYIPRELRVFTIFYWSWSVIRCEHLSQKIDTNKRPYEPWMNSPLDAFKTTSEWWKDYLWRHRTYSKKKTRIKQFYSYQRKNL